jgi:hypothetical protein
MEQPVSAHEKRRGLRGRIERLLHSGLAAWWFLLITLAGTVQFVSLFVIGAILVAFEVIVHRQQELSDTGILLVLALSGGIAFALAVYWYRTEKDKGIEPPRKRIPRKRWRRYATSWAALVAIGVGYATFWLWLFLLLGLVTAARFVGLFDGLPGNPYPYFTLVPAVLALWAFVASRHVVLEVLEAAQPPELRLASDIVRLSSELEERAKGLEKAMEEASAISQQVHGGIELEKEQLGACARGPWDKL